jgi:hypothetical protein
MTTSYYSTVFEQTADQIWTVIRNFGNYQVWLEDVSESSIEEGKSGKEVGAIRNVHVGDTTIRQRLLAQSDRDRSQTYEFCDPIPYPLRHYEATLHVTPIIDGNRAFVEWWATFDCEASQDDRWRAFFAHSFAKWLGSLRAHLAR